MSCHQIYVCMEIFDLKKMLLQLYFILQIGNILRRQISGRNDKLVRLDHTMPNRRSVKKFIFFQNDLAYSCPEGIA